MLTSQYVLRYLDLIIQCGDMEKSIQFTQYCLCSKHRDSNLNFIIHHGVISMGTLFLKMGEEVVGANCHRLIGLCGDLKAGGFDILAKWLFEKVNSASFSRRAADRHSNTKRPGHFEDGDDGRNHKLMKSIQDSNEDVTWL